MLRGFLGRVPLTFWGVWLAFSTAYLFVPAGVHHAHRQVQQGQA